MAAVVHPTTTTSSRKAGHRWYTRPCTSVRASSLSADSGGMKSRWTGEFQRPTAIEVATRTLISLSPRAPAPQRTSTLRRIRSSRNSPDTSGQAALSRFHRRPSARPRGVHQSRAALVSPRLRCPRCSPTAGPRPVPSQTTRAPPAASVANQASGPGWIGVEANARTRCPTAWFNADITWARRRGSTPRSTRQLHHPRGSFPA